ncbi:hypothetical protein NKT34_22330 [Paenibacillus polysaccharolyticus]|uniref:hypothetical protein n=1 Tax=Paenibacillus polysaccharolyticus TaxID=582692 RepID=UPI0020A19768|nr:hypothetical protein [Paenibacillus polysaccharolyticus]MCP1136044.1 hypothetical protein [Paenibacillus polysaccharolyticus]
MDWFRFTACTVAAEQRKGFRPLKNIAAGSSVGVEWFTKERSVRLCSRVLTAARAKTNQKTGEQQAAGGTIHTEAITRGIACFTVAAEQRKGFRPLKNSAAGTSGGVEWFTKERSVRLCSRVLTAARAKTNQKNRGTSSGRRNHPHRSERPKATAFTTRRATQRV